MKEPSSLQRVAALALLFGLSVYGAGHAMQAAQDTGDTRDTFYLFGTLVEVEIPDVSAVKARYAMTAVAQLLEELHHDWHAWRPGALEDLNAAIAAGRAQVVDDRMAAVLTEGRALSCASGGLFDPAIGGLIEAWGFHADTPPEGAPPAPAVIEVLRAAHPKMTDLQISGDTVRATNPAVQLDLGAYAKGAALDLAEEVLRAHGIEDAVLNAGGGVQVMGHHAARPWHVAIRDPFQWGVVAALDLAPGEALHTSGNYERFFEAGGVRFSHLIDPRSGRPVQGVVSVSVLDTNGARADAAATALAVAGPADWPRVAAAMGVRQVLMITDAGTILATPEMRARLEPVAGGFPAPITLVDLPQDVTAPICP